MMLPPEVVAGLRFDLNRPFGNGYDDDGNRRGRRTDVTASSPPPTKHPRIGRRPFGTTVKLDLNNDGLVTAAQQRSRARLRRLISDIYARQQYAKQLYVMMMLLTDQWDTQAAPNTYAWSAEPGLSQQQQQELTARAIAQWAINVVDFRDADSAMTPFEYDVNPFNGWDVDGVLGSGDDNTVADRRLVWGCEYPELLLTETLAFHDRRVQDTSTNGKLNDMSNPDLDMDQFRVPQGSLFFELYNTRGRNGTMRPARRSVHEWRQPAIGPREDGAARSQHTGLPSLAHRDLGEHARLARQYHQRRQFSLAWQDRPDEFRSLSVERQRDNRSALECVRSGQAHRAR